MENIITTLGLQNKVKNIAKEYIKFVNSNKNFHDNNFELMLLLNKIISNIQAATLLSSRMLFSESKIILRSAFETLVLFEYLLEFPKELCRYKDDNIISEIQTVYACYKRNFATFQDVVNACEKLEPQLIFPLSLKNNKNGIVTYDESTFEQYFNGKDRKSFKPLSQKVMYMLEKLKNSDHFIGDYISVFQVNIYNLNSQVAHSRLDTLFLPIDSLTNDETIREIQAYFRQSVFLLHAIIQTLKVKCNYQNPDKLNILILETMKYLKFVVPELEIEND